MQAVEKKISASERTRILLEGVDGKEGLVGKVNELDSRSLTSIEAITNIRNSHVAFKDETTRALKDNNALLQSMNKKIDDNKKRQEAFVKWILITLAAVGGVNGAGSNGVLTNLVRLLFNG